MIRYRGKCNSYKLTAALSNKLKQTSSTVREQLLWKSSSPDQVQIILSAHVVVLLNFNLVLLLSRIGLAFTQISHDLFYIILYDNRMKV